jgi:hypothetical protein
MGVPKDMQDQTVPMIVRRTVPLPKTMKAKYVMKRPLTVYAVVRMVSMVTNVINRVL